MKIAENEGAAGFGAYAAPLFRYEAAAKSRAFMATKKRADKRRPTIGIGNS